MPRFVLLFVLCIIGSFAQTASAKGVDALPSSNFQSAIEEPLPAPAPGRVVITDVHGVLFGRPFVADDARINSFSLVLRQTHKIYARVVVNLRTLHMTLPGQEFISEGKLLPEIDVYQRLKNGDKVRSKFYYSTADGYSLHVKFGRRRKAADSDTTDGAIVLRFKNGDYVTGTFVARQSPRIIWDDETIQ